MVEAAAKHTGVSFLEVYQNCNIFNDGAFDYFTERSVRQDKVLYLEDGKPMIFGKDRNKGIRMKGAHPEVVTIGENGITEADILVHNINLQDPSVAFMLARMEQPDFPQPVGIFPRRRTGQLRSADGGSNRNRNCPVRPRQPGEIDLQR
jgi:2-oxoglutarate ferredoxin oxidoreductase subunit beta